MKKVTILAIALLLLGCSPNTDELVINEEITRYNNAKKCNALFEQWLSASVIASCCVDIGDSANFAKWSAIKDRLSNVMDSLNAIKEGKQFQKMKDALK